MKSIECYLDEFHQWILGLSKKDKLLSFSYSEDKTSALGTIITQKTKSITFYEKGKSQSKCLSKSPFLTLRKEVLFDGKNTIVIKQNKKEMNLTLEEYLNQFGSLSLNKNIFNQEGFKQCLFPFLIDESTVKSADKRNDQINFLLNPIKATINYRKEVKENGGFDEFPVFSDCEFSFNPIENKARIRSSYKGKNGFLNLKIEEQTTISFKEDLSMNKDAFDSLDIDSISE